ncbi:unnamed protein product [Dicrocoelium dendriticum]|nr:unnamed protein product [Dicrocoelium dendriticum]
MHVLYLTQLPEMVTFDFLCRKAGEERSRRFSNRTVVKLELYFPVVRHPFTYEENKYLTFAMKIRTLQGKCLYPVQFRPETSFYEASNYDWPESGYCESAAISSLT